MSGLAWTFRATQAYATLVLYSKALLLFVFCFIPKVYGIWHTAWNWQCVTFGINLFSL